MAKKDKIISIEETLWDSGVARIFRTTDSVTYMEKGDRQ